MSVKFFSAAAIQIAVLAQLSIASDITNQVQHSNEVLTSKPVSVSLLPDINFSSTSCIDRETNVSINVIGGKKGSIRGVEWGGIYNIESRGVKGLQCAGFVNNVGGDVKGWQEAGICNIVGGNVYGYQSSTIVNRSNMVYGFQESGVVNISSGGVKGLQICGITNLTEGYVYGAQVSGAYNYSRNVYGIQLSGLVNQATNVKGAQIGLINISDSIDGIPLGLFNYVRSVGLHYQLYADEIGGFSVALRNGGKHIYTLLTAGMKIHDSTNVALSAGWGIGARVPFLQKYFANMDITAQALYSDRYHDEEVDFLGKIRIGGGWQFNPRIAVFGGLSMNMFLSNNNDGKILPDYIPEAEKCEDVWIRVWPGAYIGLEI